jgi:hypothetical protein
VGARIQFMDAPSEHDTLGADKVCIDDGSDDLDCLFEIGVLPQKKEYIQCPNLQEALEEEARYLSWMTMDDY